MGRLLFFVAFLFIFGCEGDVEKRARMESDAKAIQSKLPKGCGFHDAGSYKTYNGTSLPIVYVTCGDVTAMNSIFTVGKSQQPFAAVAIGNVDKQLSELEKINGQIEEQSVNITAKREKLLAERRVLEELKRIEN